MIICDEYLALAALSNNLPQRIADEQIATTPAAWSRVLRAQHRQSRPKGIGRGQLGRIIDQLTPDGRSQLAAPDPWRLSLLDPRPFLSSSARLAVVHPLSYMAAEMAAASLFHQAPLHFQSERNVPPGFRDLLREENLPDFVIVS